MNNCIGIPCEDPANEPGFYKPYTLSQIEPPGWYNGDIVMYECTNGTHIQYTETYSKRSECFTNASWHWIDHRDMSCVGK